MRSGTPRPLRTLPALILHFLLCTSAWAAVTVTPWGPPVIHTCPPDSLPPEFKEEGWDAGETPKLDPYQEDIEGRWNASGSTFTVDSADVQIGGRTHIWWPAGDDSATLALHAHENGHAQLNGWEYGRTAKKKIDDALRGYRGMKFTGAGATDEERQADALRQAKMELDRRLQLASDAIYQQMKVLAGAFDDFTDHGRNPDCDADLGVRLAEGDHSLAPPPGWFPKSVIPSAPYAVIYPVCRLEDLARMRIITGPATIEESRIPLEPLIARGQVEVDSVLFIGEQENGTIHLADTDLMIRDSVSGDTLMRGYLLEAAVMPSNVHGYAQMIQAHLELLPAWAGGFWNPIGSYFLADMEAVDLADGPSTAWFYFPDSISWTEPWETSVRLVLGVGSPDPSAVEPRPIAGPGRLVASPNPSHSTLSFAWKPVVGRVDLEVFDITGARRWTRRLEGARGAWTWHVRDANGARLPPGVYFARLTGAGTDLRTRLVLLP